MTDSDCLYSLVTFVLDGADEEDYFKEDDDETETVSCIVGNGVARPSGGVTGGFSLSSLVEYGEDEDNDDEDSLKNGTRDGRFPLKLPSMHLGLGTYRRERRM